MNTNDTVNNSKLALFPGTKMVILDADTFDSICILLEDMKTYIRKTGARVKYTQPEQFAAVCQTYRNRIEKELEKGKQFNKTLKEYQECKNIIKYKGYQAIIEYSAIDATLFGKVIGIKDRIIFEIENPSKANTVFKEVIDDYLEIHKEHKNNQEDTNNNNDENAKKWRHFELTT